MTDFTYASLYVRLSSISVLQYSCYLGLIQVNAVIIMLTVYCNTVLEVNPFTANLFSMICFFSFMPSTWLLITVTAFHCKVVPHSWHLRDLSCTCKVNNSLKFVLVQHISVKIVSNFSIAIMISTNHICAQV